MAIPKSALRVLTELTGEPRFEVALMITLKDTIDHKMERIEDELKKYENKYNISFEDFKKMGEEEKIPNQYSYEVEKDYLEWEGLLTRKEKLLEIRKWLI